MPASSSMMSTVPVDEDDASAKLRRGTTARSDIDSLPHQREIQIKRSAAARMALYPNLPRVFLNDAVSDGQAEAGPFALAFTRRRLSRKKRVVDALDVLLGDADSVVGHDHAHTFTVGRGNPENSTIGHSIPRIQKQIQENLLQTSGIAAN